MVTLRTEVQRIDAESIVGGTIIGGKDAVLHAVISRDNSTRLYCKPSREADTMDFGPETAVTCSLCKSKWKKELRS